MKKVVSFWHELLFIYSTLRPAAGIVLLGNCGALLLAIVALVLDPSTRWIFIAIAVGSAIFGGWLLVRDIVRVPPLEDQCIDKAFMYSLQPSSEEEKAGFVLMKDNYVTDGAVLYSPAFNRFLYDNDLDLVKNPVRGKLVKEKLKERPELFEAILRFYGSTFRSAGKDFRNESKIGICSPLRGNVDFVEIFKGDYLRAYALNPA